MRTQRGLAVLPYHTLFFSLTIFVRISAVIVQADQPNHSPQVLDHPEPTMTTELPSAPPLELEESDLDFRFLVFTV